MRVLMSLIMSLFVAFVFISTSAEASFKDLDTLPWAVEAIEYLNDKKVVNGYDSQRFGPKDNITRSQAAIMLVNALYPDQLATKSPGFTDVAKDHAYYNSIALAAEKGLVNGYPNETFEPESNITRAEASVMIDKAYKVDRMENPIGFSDVTPIEWAVDSILDLSSHNIINGYSDGLFKPRNPITRAEFSLILAATINPEFISTGAVDDNFANHQLNAHEKEVVKLTNAEREKHGLNPLSVDRSLSRVASYKSRDMAINDYFAHNSPTYGSPFEMMRNFNISYMSAAENIAYGYSSSANVVEGWMNSQGHRENILTPGLTHIGVGYVQDENGRPYWTQMFIGK